MEILHIFSVTGNKNRKIWQEMEVGGRCGGARAFFDAAGQQGGFRACGRELLSFRVERKQPKNAT
ncbi:MAG: hypothetical protein ACLU8T_03435 [Oscillospiraceae bacterium]